MSTKKHIRQYITITLVQAIALLLVSLWMDGLQIRSFSAAIGVAFAYLAMLVLYWWVFLNFFSRLPVWLYPLVTFALTGGIFMLLGNLLPGILIADINTAISISMILSAVSAVVGSLLSMDIDARFDQYVTRRLVQLRGKPEETEKNGFLFLQIDGLGEKILRRALAEKRLPTLQRWLDEGTHRILSWETDFSSQTGAIQSGILLGNNDDVPAYRWWDRVKRRIVRAGNFADAAEIEARLSNGQGLLANGGASRGNMFSGDAAESLFTISTLGHRERELSPGFYLYLINPFIIASLNVRYSLCVLKEWWQALLQKIRRDRYIISARSPKYAFLRAAVSPLLQDITTYTIISDILRGVPSIYALYGGYDDLAHFAGMDSPEALQSLEEIDRYLARIDRVLQIAPRPYHTIVLSDHGQSTGPTFRAGYGMTLQQLVKKSIKGNLQIFAPQDVNDTWDKINAFLSDSIHADTRSARLLRLMLQTRTRDGVVTSGPPGHELEDRQNPAGFTDSGLVVLASGCTGLVYFTDFARRATYEEIQSRYPDLLIDLVSHPGIGFVVVRSSQDGDLVLGKAGIYFLEQDNFEGENPLAGYSANAARLLRRESSFSNCPDILVNTHLDPLTGELPGFENQVSHHGGLGGPQNHPFILYPAALPYDGKSPVGAMEVNRLFRGWCEESRPGAEQ